MEFGKYIKCDLIWETHVPLNSFETNGFIHSFCTGYIPYLVSRKTNHKYLVTKFVKNHVQNGRIATTYTQQFFKIFSTTCVVLPNNMTNVILSTCKSISISIVEHWTYV